jgi:hypothetical protein
MGATAEWRGSGFSQSGAVTFLVRQRSSASNIFSEAMRHMRKIFKTQPFFSAAC